MEAMLLHNQWLWFHVLGGAILAKIALRIGFSRMKTISVVAVLALLWEFFEYSISNILKIYGSYEYALLDSAGDVLGTIICCIVVVI